MHILQKVFSEILDSVQKKWNLNSIPFLSVKHAHLREANVTEEWYSRQLSHII